MQATLRGGWVLEFTEGQDARIYNVAPDGSRKFFEVTTVGDQYGAPRVVQEPDLGIPLRDAGIEKDGNIVGAVVLDAGDQVILRASWSNLRHMQKKPFGFSRDGQFILDGQSQGYVYAIVQPDKNRLVGYVAYISPTPVTQGQVKHLELETLAILAR